LHWFVFFAKMEIEKSGKPLFALYRGTMEEIKT